MSMFLENGEEIEILEELGNRGYLVRNRYDEIKLFKTKERALDCLKEFIEHTLSKEDIINDWRFNSCINACIKYGFKSEIISKAHDIHKNHKVSNMYKVIDAKRKEIEILEKELSQIKEIGQEKEGE